MLSEKRALITGSTSGIGLAIAEALARQGASIMLNGLGDPKENEALKKKIAKTYTVPVEFDGSDLSTPEGCQRLVEHTIDLWGGIDILVNNAGIQFTAPVEEFPPEKWRLILDINLSAYFYTIQKALPGMYKKGWGRIINIASTHGLVASPLKSAYVASKHGILGLTKVVALETAGKGITCNAICPGWVLTPLVEKQIQEKAKKEDITVEKAKMNLLLEKQPSGEFITPQEIGEFVLFLCSDATSQMTGAALTMDGGWTAR